MKKEIERRFILKSLPINPNYEIQNIIQYNYLVDNVWNRIRKIDSDNNDSFFLHTIKTYIDGICYEEEKDYSYNEYKILISELHSGKYKSRQLLKTRFVFYTGIMADFDGEIKELKWEIDLFNFNLVIAVLEVPSLDYKIEIPDFIKKVLIYEVTGIPEFSSRNLADPLKIEIEA